MNQFVSVVRIFYTVTLLLFGLAIAALLSASRAAEANGHAPDPFLGQSIVELVGLFVLLLASRLLYYRSPRWLWLGLPTIVIIYGFVGFSIIYPILLGY